ncbi:MAG: extracellular solute-binding protein [Deltaproteobacteria bacterium]|nr:extracellular solute-binding protein [Deltaproteobacteria bacterium]
MRRSLVLAGLWALLLAPTPASAGEITLWHAYRAAEKEALEQLIADFEARYPGSRVRALSVPNDAFASKLSAAIPRGNGPDLFIFAHERIGGWSRDGVIAPVDLGALPMEEAGFLGPTVEAVTFEGKTWGVPLAYKSLALFYNRQLVAKPPVDTDEMLVEALRLSEGDRFGLVWPTDEFYFHAPWLFGHRARLFDEAGRPRLESPEMAASLHFVRDLVLEKKVIPAEANTALATRLFNEGQVGMVVNGPWFVGDIAEGIDYGIAVLPVVSSTGEAARPFLTVEALFFSGPPGGGGDPETAKLFAAELASGAGARLRAVTGRQTVAWEPTYADPEVAGDPVLKVFRAQLPFTVPMDSRPAMQAIWEPAKGALMSALRGDDVDELLHRAQRRIDAATRPRPARAEPLPFVIGTGVILLLIVGAWVFWVRRNAPDSEESLGVRVWRARGAYSYLAPAFLGLLMLVLMPFAVGLALGFTNYDAGVQGSLLDKLTFVGWANFQDILFGSTYGPTDPLSFYFTLVVTVLWTVANVALHVTLGLALALLLARPWLKLKGVYRALLIVPWAVPNYITALIWKGMFHKQFGAINGILEWFGMEPVGWFSSFWTAFTANVVTNTWLGFPFMMVIALGALQSIPSDLYEAAQVDGASAWQRFRNVTLPLLKPAMLPAVILGMIWTFNMFNIVYLVSGGEPDGATDILISEAYRWAFQRQAQYGYAAAYATLIFIILVVYTLGTRKLSGGEEVG